MQTESMIPVKYTPGKYQNRCSRNRGLSDKKLTAKLTGLKTVRAIHRVRASEVRLYIPW